MRCPSASRMRPPRRERCRERGGQRPERRAVVEHLGGEDEVEARLATARRGRRATTSPAASRPFAPSVARTNASGAATRSTNDDASAARAATSPGRPRPQPDLEHATGVRAARARRARARRSSSAPSTAAPADRPRAAARRDRRAARGRRRSRAERRSSPTSMDVTHASNPAIERAADARPRARFYCHRSGLVLCTRRLCRIVGGRDGRDGSTDGSDHQFHS